VDSSTASQITTPCNLTFFLSPQSPLQRQYEALRAYLVDEEPSGDVARRFGYSPARDRVRDLAVAMRKRNLSVYDMQRELAAAGHTISINSLTVLLREEGFSRLPRRADDERPVTIGGRPILAGVPYS
jgi:hypothetical protein